MATNLEKLLNKVEKNYHKAEEQTKHEIVIGGETYEALSFTRAQKKDFLYSKKTSTKDITVGEIAKWAKPYIYKSMQLSELAVKAKDAGYIKAYYDITEMLFEPDEIIEIIGFLFEINKMANSDVAEEELEEVKKP